MIHTVYASELREMPILADTMFKHRAMQFRDRLKWEVHDNENGHERDEYDNLDPMYLILERSDGTHGGSMRFLPTTGSTMIGQHFTHLTDGVEIKSPFIWECTRFCLAPNTGPMDSWKLLMETIELGLEYGLNYFIGVFDKRMMGVYRRIGWPPEVIGEAMSDGSLTCAGLWSIDEEARSKLTKRGSIAAYSTIPSLDQARVQNAKRHKELS